MGPLSSRSRSWLASAAGGGALAIGFLIALVFSFGWWTGDTAELPPTRSGGSVVRDSSARSADSSAGKHDTATIPGHETGVQPEHGGSAESAPARVPQSHVGTTPDGAVSVDAGGRLRVNAELRSLFDYVLLAQRELSRDELRSRLRSIVAAELPPAAAEEAMALFERYLSYLERGDQLMSDASREDIAGTFDSMRTLRREIFGEEDAQALFGTEEAIRQIVLERRRLLEDEDLSETDRARMIEDLRAQLPESVRAAESTSTLPLRAYQEQVRLLERGASEQELRDLREDMVGAAAASRLEVLDAERATWHDRVADYRQARAKIDAARSLSEAARSRALSELRSAHFQGPEHLRIESLDRIDGLD